MCHAPASYEPAHQRSCSYRPRVTRPSQDVCGRNTQSLRNPVDASCGRNFEPWALALPSDLVSKVGSTQDSRVSKCPSRDKDGKSSSWHFREKLSEAAARVEPAICRQCGKGRPCEKTWDWHSEADGRTTVIVAQWVGA